MKLWRRSSFEFSMAVLLGAMGGSLAAPASADAPWVVRPVEFGYAYSRPNVGMMCNPLDALTVGYAFSTSSATGDLGLASIDAGGKYFSIEHSLSNNLASGAASFAMDPFGLPYYVKKSTSGGMILGMDAQDWGGIGEPLSPLFLLPASYSPGTPTLALDRHGIPHITGRASYSSLNVAYLASFDVVNNQWKSTLVSNQTSTVGVAQMIYPNALTFDLQNRPVLARYVPTSNSWGVNGTLILSRQEANGSWTEWTVGSGSVNLGVTCAAAPDGSVGFVYSDGRSMYYGKYDGGVIGSLETITTTTGAMVPGSLAYDSQGNPVLVYNPVGTGSLPVQYARRSDMGEWTVQDLPVVSTILSSSPFGSGRSTISFDLQGRPQIATVVNTSSSEYAVVLLSQNVQALTRGDFNLDDSVTDADVPGFVQAIKQPASYQAAHTQLIHGDLLALGDFSGDLRLTSDDARNFIEGLQTAPEPNLPNRKAGYLAFDLADANPQYGSGTGNFFAITLFTSKTYQAGDSRGDMSSLTPGSYDGTVDANDIEYVRSQLGTANPKADINGDLAVTQADLVELLQSILGIIQGDMNGDGMVNNLDIIAFVQGLTDPDEFAQNYPGVQLLYAGDMNLDGAFNNQDINPFVTVLIGAGLSADASLGGTVPEPTSLGLLMLGSLALCRRRRES